MKKFILLGFILIGCCSESPEQIQARINKLAEETCSCHGGIYAFVYDAYLYTLRCKDGLQLSGKGPIEKQGFSGGCK